jgi:hypothetical protein
LYLSPLLLLLLQIVAANQLDSSSGGPISIISGKVEEGPDIGVDKVGAEALFVTSCLVGGGASSHTVTYLSKRCSTADILKSTTCLAA